MKIHEIIQHAQDKTSEWSEAVVTPLESELLAEIRSLTAALDQAYALAWNACPRHFREEETVTRGGATGGESPEPPNGPEEWHLNVFPDMRTHEFNGKEFRIALRTDPIDQMYGVGYCERRSVPDAYLWIHETIRGVRLVEVAVHEGLHACLDERFTEEEVDRVARDVSAFVLRLMIASDPAARKAYGLGDERPATQPEGVRE